MRKLFTKGYDALTSASDEKRLALIEMLFADAVEAKLNGDLDRARANVNRGVEIYTQVESKLKSGSVAMQSSEARFHEFERITRLVDNLLVRSTGRLDLFRDEDFAQAFFSLSKVDAPAAPTVLPAVCEARA